METHGTRALEQLSFAWNELSRPVTEGPNDRLQVALTQAIVQAVLEVGEQIALLRDDLYTLDELRKRDRIQNKEDQ